MTQAEGYAADLINQANSLISKVQGDLSAAAAFYKSIDVDPAKIAGALAPLMGQKQQDELAQIVAADRAAIDQEVAEEAARLRFGAAATASAPKAFRSMA